jgi:hypothetical protein
MLPRMHITTRYLALPRCRTHVSDFVARVAEISPSRGGCNSSRWSKEIILLWKDVVFELVPLMSRCARLIFLQTWKFRLICVTLNRKGYYCVTMKKMTQWSFKAWEVTQRCMVATEQYGCDNITARIVQLGTGDMFPTRQLWSGAGKIL